MSPVDVPAALALISAAVLFVITWAVWVYRTDIKPSRAARRADTDVARRCHVIGCAFPARVPVTRITVTDRWEVITVCEAHADEGAAYGWWMRVPGWRFAS